MPARGRSTSRLARLPAYITSKLKVVTNYFLVNAPAPVRRPTPTGDASSYYEKGNDYFDEGKHQLAVNEFTAAIWLNPNFQLAYFWRGGAYHQLGQYQRAIQDLDAAIRLDPNNAEAYVLRWAAYNSMGQYTKADADKAKACFLDSEYC